MKKFLNILSFLCIIILFSSCNNSKKSKVSNSPDKNHSSVSTAIPNLKYNFDPRFCNDVNQEAVLSQLFEGLTEYSAHGKISLNQAENIEKNENFTVWKITLRDDLTWSDNSKITSKDYINSWVSILDKKNKNPNYFKLFFIKNAKKYYDEKSKLSELGIKEIDSKTIEVTMEYPVKNFDEILSNTFLFPVKDINKKDFDNIISNGAFLLSKLTEEEIILEKNKNYWDSVNVRVNFVNLKLIDNSIVAYQMFDLGQIDFFGLPFYEIPYERRLDASKKPEILNFKTNIFEFLETNTENSILKEKSIRNILNANIDSNFLSSYVLYNNSEPIIENKKLNSSEIENLKQTFNEKTKKINLSEITLNLKYSDSKLSERILASLSKDWIDKYKIKVNIQNKDDFDLKHMSFNMGTTDELDIKYYINHKYQNDNGSKMYKNIDQINDENFILPLYKRSFSILVKNKIQGLFVSPNGKLLIKNLNLSNK
ncbi:MAG: ABC transporter substrate-binding protein [Peptoniphilaceae bacterium]|nr:ABC transporter substrate-binding protein [Peptoniphilaceae bacterium]